MWLLELGGASVRPWLEPAQRQSWHIEHDGVSDALKQSPWRCPCAAVSHPWRRPDLWIACCMGKVIFELFILFWIDIFYHLKLKASLIQLVRSRLVIRDSVLPTFLCKFDGKKHILIKIIDWAPVCSVTYPTVEIQRQMRNFPVLIKLIPEKGQYSKIFSEPKLFLFDNKHFEEKVGVIQECKW